MFNPSAYCTAGFSLFFERTGAPQLAEKGLYALSLSEGSCILTAGDSPLLLQKEELAVFYHGGGVSLTGENCTGHLCLFKGAVADTFEASLEKPAVYRLPYCRESVTLLHEIALLYPAGQPARLSAACYVFLCSLPEAGHVTTAESPLVLQAVAAIRQNYDKLYGVEELAEGLGVSKNHLIRVFHSAVGVTPGCYLTLTRIEAAKRLLCRPGYTLETIAALSGFSGAGYLCQAFKRETGLTPTQYRATHLPVSSGGTPEDGHWAF